MAVIDEAECNEEYNLREGREPALDCDAFKSSFLFWRVGCIVAWLIHITIAIILCAWGCEGNNLESMQEKERREDRKKADLEAAERRLQQ